MNILWTFLIPGLAQIRSGKAGKGLAMLACAFFGGALSGGLLWFACGGWSFWDYQQELKGGTGSRQTQGANTTTTAGPAAATAAAPAADKPDNSVKLALLKYSFGLLVIAMGLIFAHYKGLSLQTMKLFGMVDMQFLDSRLAAAGRVETRDAGSDGVPVSAAAADPLPKKSHAAPPRAKPPAEPRASAPSSTSRVNLGGKWSLENGGQYQITQKGDEVRLKEVSWLYFIPVETAVCEGERHRAGLRARCKTMFDTFGEMRLALSGDGGTLAGEYVDATTGVTVALSMSRAGSDRD